MLYHRQKNFSRHAQHFIFTPMSMTVFHAQCFIIHFLQIKYHYQKQQINNTKRRNF